MSQTSQHNTGGNTGGNNGQTDGKGRLGLIAGYGRLPLDVAIAAREAGENPYIFVLDQDNDDIWSGFDSQSLHIGDFAAVKSTLAAKNIDRLILAGGVKQRPQISEIRPTLNTLFALPGILKKVISGGDDALLRGFIALIEAQGCTVISAQDIMPDLLAKAGTIGAIQMTKDDKKDVTIAAQAARHLGILDIGQGAIAVGGRVVALEALEGTDNMLSRVADLRDQARLPNNKKGVLVKLCKPQQDTRVDLPTIGITTIENAHTAGLAGIAIEAGRSFISDRDNMIARADELGLFIFGLTREDIAPIISQEQSSAHLGDQASDQASGQAGGQTGDTA
jgi:DUF1009 family protein